MANVELQYIKTRLVANDFEPINIKDEAQTNQVSENTIQVNDSLNEC